MDRVLLRKLAKAEFKKMMKGTPKNRRMSFAQAFPMIKTMLESGSMGNGGAASEMSASDTEMLNSMMDTSEHVHGPDCHHDDVIEVQHTAAI